MSESDLSNPWGSASAILPTATPVSTAAIEDIADTAEVFKSQIDSKEPLESDNVPKVAPELAPVQGAIETTPNIEDAAAGLKNLAAQPQVPVEDNDNDDDFGDFGAGEAVFPSVSDQTNPLSLAVEGDDRVHSLVASLLASSNPHARDLSLHLSAALASSTTTKIAPASSTASSTFNGSLLVNLVPPLTTPSESSPKKDISTAIVLVPHTHFNNLEWVHTWNSLALNDYSPTEEAAHYADGLNHAFRWKKSATRTQFLKALGMDEETLLAEAVVASADAPNATVADSTTNTATDTAAATSASNSSNISTSDPRQADIDEAKKHCSITEAPLSDEIRKMTTAELNTLIQSLASSQLKMQEQSNYWLDAKEQLLMDAEMHNKMIASLVQYATQGSKGSPRTGKSMLGGKKKK
ncbi:hypothetical protein BDR26DRAFT_923008 [Obelidium mucronatum]|nr:hypothetical protein BDR26DRAFT_923008 [Obelidium mucronatum]